MKLEGVPIPCLEARGSSKTLRVGEVSVEGWASLTEEGVLKGTLEGRC